MLNATDDGIFLVTYDTRSFLRLHKVKIEWGYNKDSKEQPKQINPTLRIHAFNVNTHCKPDGSEQGDMGSMSAFGTNESAQYMLTHLEMVPPSMDLTNPDEKFPSILTAFKYVPSIVSSISVPAQQSPLTPSTLLWTWKLTAHPPSGGCLSPAFEQLAAKKKSIESARSRAFLEITKHSWIAVNNVVLSITPFRYNTIIALSLADGSVDWLHRDTMQPVQADYNFTEITSLPQSGFTFVTTDPVIATELSPSGCLAVYQDTEGALKLKQMESTISSLDAPTDDERRTAIATALALQWTSNLLQYRPFQDDIVSLMPPATDTTLMYEFLEQAHSALGYTLDFTSDDPSKASAMLFRTPWLQKLLGAQAVLGSIKRGKRSLPAKLSLVTLNLRLAAFVIIMVFRIDVALKPGKLPLVSISGQSTDTPQELAASLSGMLQWSLDFMVYILQEIDRLHEHLRTLPSYPNFTKAEMMAFIGSDHENSPALLLLFSSISRVLIRMICRPLRHGWIHCMNGSKNASSPRDKEAFVKCVRTYTSSPVCMQAAGANPGAPAIYFEVFSAQVDQLVKEAYGAAGVGDALKAQAERDLFIRAEVPDALMPAIRRLLVDTWPRFLMQPVVDLGRIHKHDIAWLGFTEDRWTRRWHEKHVVDVLRKTVVMPGVAKVRRCARCGMYMEDILPGPQWPAWVMMNMKNCVCLGNWSNVEGYRENDDGDGADEKGENGEKKEG